MFTLHVEESEGKVQIPHFPQLSNISFWYGGVKKKFLKIEDSNKNSHQGNIWIFVSKLNTEFYNIKYS